MSETTAPATTADVQVALLHGARMATLDIASEREDMRRDQIALAEALREAADYVAHLEMPAYVADDKGQPSGYNRWAQMLAERVQNNSTIDMRLRTLRSAATTADLAATRSRVMVNAADMLDEIV